MDTPERGVWGERRPKGQGDFTNNFSMYTYTPQNITWGCVGYIHCNRITVSVKNLDV